MSVEDLLPGRLSAPFRRGFNSVAPQNVGDCIVCQHMSKIRQGSLNPSITPIPILLSHPGHECCNIGAVVPHCVVRFHSYLLAIRFRCQANRVSGVTMVAT
jgi:hypothetical protein